MRYITLLVAVPILLTPPNAPEVNAVTAITGGDAAARATVEQAIERFIEADLALPPLEIHIHSDIDGCDGYQGRFRPRPGRSRIDLCFDREFLVLHELAHAWEHVTLDDDHRDEFATEWEYATWNSREVPWSQRGIERAADAIAAGLLSTPLPAPDSHARELAKFESLTGSASPRLSPTP